MARNYDLDLSRLVEVVRHSPVAAEKGAKAGLGDIKDAWIRKARDIAPLDTGNLRREIDGKVEGDGLNSSLIVTANATTKGGFNYAYYIHEEDAGGKQLRTPGTVKQFLDDSADEEEFFRAIENAIKEEILRGWR